MTTSEEFGYALNFTLNGSPVTTEVAGNTLLIDLLRDKLGLTGTHLGCDTSQCGACLVHIDGASSKACAVMAGDLDGADIVTIEGMAASDGKLSSLQQAFQDHHGLQCGFCTPGMIMSAASLLKDVPQPSEAQIRAHLDGNFCRCTGYQNIVKAILAASGQEVEHV